MKLRTEGEEGDRRGARLGDRIPPVYRVGTQATGNIATACLIGWPSVQAITAPHEAAIAPGLHGEQCESSTHFNTAWLRLRFQPGAFATRALGRRYLDVSLTSRQPNDPQDE